MLLLLSLHAPALAYDVVCGLTITTNLTLTGDVDCTGFTGNAIVLGADGIMLDGGGYTLLSPDASAGVYVSGWDGLTVRSLTVDGGDVGVHVDGVGNLVSQVVVVNTDIAVVAYGSCAA